MSRAAGYTEEQNYADALKLAGMLKALAGSPQLTIACIQGAAMGGGSMESTFGAETNNVLSTATIRAAIAHDEIVTPTDFPRYAQLGAIPVLSFQWEKPAPDTLDGAQNLTLTADYQFITNPAYNADRGPVHVFAGRAHWQF